MDNQKSLDVLPELHPASKNSNGMYSPSLSADEQRELAKNITMFLSSYKYICDSYIIEFFSEDLWETLPLKWQQVLCDLSPPQIADLLLDRTSVTRSYTSVWPLSLLALRTTAHTLSFPRMPQGEGGKERNTLKSEFLENQSQSSLLGHLFRKHLKPKKQHEIRRMSMLVKQLCDYTNCKSVVDVGSGQGHLTRFLSFGLGLSVTGIEADPTLVARAYKFDGQLLCSLKKEKRKQNDSSHLSVSGPSPHHVVGWVNPKTSWRSFMKLWSRNEFACRDQRTATKPSKITQRESLYNLGTEQPQDDQTGCPDQEVFSVSKETVLECPPQDPALKLQCNSLSYLKHRKKIEAGKETSPRCCGQPVNTYVKEFLLQADTISVEDGEMHTDLIMTGLHACGDLSATLLRHFVNCPYACGITSVACCYMKITTKENPFSCDLDAPPPVSTVEFSYPMSSWVQCLPGHQLSYKAREGACHAMEDYVKRLREDSSLLKIHCYRATLETFIRDTKSEMRRAGIHTIKRAHLLPFTEYARLALPCVGLPSDLPLDIVSADAMLSRQHQVVVYFSLALLLAPVVETLIILDRIIYLQEKGIRSQLVPLFDPDLSPRNLVLVAVKPNRSRNVDGTMSAPKNEP